MDGLIDYIHSTDVPSYPNYRNYRNYPNYPNYLFLFFDHRKSSKYFEEVKNFTWHSNIQEDEKQEELRKCLESELHPDELPYLTLPILAPGRHTSVPGFPDIVGLLKVRCRIFDAEADKR